MSLELKIFDMEYMVCFPSQVGRLHCVLPWWEDATVDFMASGGYNVCSKIKKVHNEHKHFAVLCAYMCVFLKDHEWLERLNILSKINGWDWDCLHVQIK